MAEYEEGGVDPTHLGHAVDQGLQVVDAVVNLLTIPVSCDYLHVGIVRVEICLIGYVTRPITDRRLHLLYLCSLLLQIRV